MFWQRSGKLLLKRRNCKRSLNRSVREGGGNSGKSNIANPREVLSKKGMVNTSKLDLAITRTLVTLWNRFLEVGWGGRYHSGSGSE